MPQPLMVSAPTKQYCDSRLSVAFASTKRGLSYSCDSYQTHRELVYRPLQFYERRQLFLGAHDETLSVAVCVHNPDRLPFKINC